MAHNLWVYKSVSAEASFSASSTVRTFCAKNIFAPFSTPQIISTQTKSCNLHKKLVVHFIISLFQLGYKDKIEKNIYISVPPLIRFVSPLCVLGFGFLGYRSVRVYTTLK